MEFTGLKAIYYNKPDAEFKIWGIADQHLTNRAVDWKLIEEDRDAIDKDPYSFWIEGGDYADWHLPSHPYLIYSTTQKGSSYQLIIGDQHNG